MSHRKWKETRDGEVPSQKELSSYFEELLVVKFLVKRNLVPQMRKFSPALKETKQQPSMLPGPAVPGCCLISFHFLWAIHPIRPVHFAIYKQHVHVDSFVHQIMRSHSEPDLGSNIPCMKREMRKKRTDHHRRRRAVALALHFPTKAPKVLNSRG